MRSLILGYIIDYSAGEVAGCSSELIIADRIFYVKHLASGSARFFSGDQNGIIQKEISKAEFDLWVNILADNEAQAQEIQKKLILGKKF
jgi:hypothetical protein